MSDGIKKPQPNLSFDDLHKQAVASVPVLESSAQNLLDRLKSQNPELFKDVVFEMGPVKEHGRALSKVNTDYGGDHRQIKDLVRGQFVVDTPEQVVALKKAILEEMDIDSMKDKFAEPTPQGYRDINAKIELENGHIAEIQIQQRDILQVKNGIGHDLMVERQNILRTESGELSLGEREIKVAEIEAKSKHVYGAAAHDGKLNQLVKLELRNQFIYKGKLDANGSALGAIADSFGKLGKNGGFVVGAAIGTLAGAFTLAAGGSKAEAAEVVYESAVPFGETQIDLVRGDTGAAARSATIETTSTLGSLGGAVAGAAVGAAIGSVVPVIGTAIGGVVGGVAGALGGGVGAGYITAKVYDNFESIKGSVINVSHDAVDALSSAARETASFFGDAWDWATGNDEPPIDLTAVFNGLPNTVTDDMPPEVQALIEVKASSILFEKQYEDLKEQGSLSAVEEYMKDNPIEPEAAQTYEDRPAIQTTYAAGMKL